jgi:hypothetical protein
VCGVLALWSREYLMLSLVGRFCYMYVLRLCREDRVRSDALRLYASNVSYLFDVGVY